MVHTTCAVRDCMSSSRINKNLKFHQFPHTEERSKLWIEACGRPDLDGKSSESLRNTHICSLHFERRMYGKRSLKKTAIPILHLPVKGTYSVHTQTDPKVYILKEKELDLTKGYNYTGAPTTVVSKVIYLHTSAHSSCQAAAKLTDDIPCKKRSREELFNESKKLKLSKEKYKDVTKKQFLDGCDKFLSPPLATIAKTQVYLRSHSKGNRYTREFKLFCLNLYYLSPLSYRFLSKTICMPTKSILANMYIPVSSKINEEMWDFLTASVKGMSSSDRHCILCMDEMTLKCSLYYDSKQDKILGLHEINNEQQPHAARYACTLILRGIMSDWKQCIGFAFISSRKIEEQLRSWIINTVRKLFSLGLNVRAFVSDMSSDFLQYSKLLGISKDMCSFTIDDKKLYYIYDVSHLIKSIRNSLLNNNYEFENKVVKWDDIQNLHDMDKIKDIRCVPRLTDAHLIPNVFQRQKVRFASEVFSNSVKAALETYVASGSLNVANGTIEFIELMNGLFDLLNSSNIHSLKPSNKAYKGDDRQSKLLHKARNIFYNLTIKNKTTGQDVTNKLKFLDALIVTINSIIQLQSDMKCEGFKYLLTRRLNNDCLEKFFRAVRQVAGNCREPTCIQFTRAFRKTFIWELMKLSNEKNNSEDLDNILIKFHSFLQNESLFVNSTSVSNEIVPKVRLNYDLPEENAFIYTCGYVLRRCVEKHKCIAMMKYVSIYHDQFTIKNEGINQRDYSAESNMFGSLQVPPDDFIEYCLKLDETLKSTFTTFVGNNIGSQLYQQLREVNFNTKPCPCFPSKYLITTFLRIRIYYIVQFNNRNITTSKSKCRKNLSVLHS